MLLDVNTDMIGKYVYHRSFVMYNMSSIYHNTRMRPEDLISSSIAK